MKFLSELKRENIKANGVKINTFYSKSDKETITTFAWLSSISNNVAKGYTID